MTADESKALITRYIEEVWNQADLAAFEAMVAPTFTYTIGSQPARDKATMAMFLQGVHAAFPDWHVQMDSIAADGDTVAVRWSGRVTHGGVFVGIPPTGKEIDVCGINCYTVKDGQILQEWEQMDTVGMLQQMGVLPPSPGAQ